MGGQLESDVVVLNKEVAKLKNIVNTHEQRSRSSIIRISGFPLTEDEKQIKSSSALSNRVFDRILGPILNLAASNGLLELAPTVANTIAAYYRIGNPAAEASADFPPPLIVKLRNPELRVHIMMCKKEAVFGPTVEEKAAGCRLQVLHDCGGPDPACLQEAQGDQGQGGGLQGLVCGGEAAVRPDWRQICQPCVISVRGH